MFREGGRDHPQDVDRGLSDFDGQVLHDRRSDQRAEGRAKTAPAALDRRRRRAGDPEAGRAIRRCLQLRRRRSRGHPRRSSKCSSGTATRSAAITTRSSSRPRSTACCSTARPTGSRRPQRPVSSWTCRTKSSTTATGSGRRKRSRSRLRPVIDAGIDYVILYMPGVAYDHGPMQQFAREVIPQCA